MERVLRRWVELGRVGDFDWIAVLVPNLIRNQHRDSPRPTPTHTPQHTHTHTHPTDFSLDFYTEVQDLSYLADAMAARGGRFGERHRCACARDR